MELIKTRNVSYGWYEELLLKRDQVCRETGSIFISYTREFGELITAIFREKINCIRQKKAIAYCQSMINRGETVDLDRMKSSLDAQMTLYYSELKKMMDKNEEARKADISSAADVQRAKKLYRKLAKLIHPDINPMTNRIPELSDLWNRIVAAYHSNNPIELKELEVLVNKVVTEQGLDGTEIEIPNIDDRIRDLEDEINEIITTEPYIYQELLLDLDAVAEKKKELQKELEEYKAYYSELEETLNTMLAESGVQFIWKMN